MMGKKRPNIRAWGTLASACFLALFATTAHSGDPVPRAGVKSAGYHARPALRQTLTVSGASCIVNADCDDQDPCTNDTCTGQLCENVAITDCVACAPAPTCSAIDVVFVVDTSGSMRDEAAALCGAIQDIATELGALGIDVRASMLGITEAPGSAFSCLTGDVVTQFGEAVPGCLDTCTFAGGASQFESWGPASAIVAAGFPWRNGALRLIIPMSDEGPCNGNRPDGCNDPGDDRDSIDNAVSIANAKNVVVSPITGTGSNACVQSLASSLATRTGGTTFQTLDAGTELRQAIESLVLGTCGLDDGCPDRDACLVNECVADVCVESFVPDCKACTATGFCDDSNACTVETCVDFACVSTPDFDEATSCCEPMTGALNPLDDGDRCTEDLCDPATGIVTHTIAPDGTLCSDGFGCTVCAVCIDGVCGGGAPTDCRALADECNIGVCNELLQQCEKEPRNEGGFCDDNLFCTENDACISGVCSGQPTDCTALGSDCSLGMCDEAMNKCVAVTTNEGGMCKGPDCPVDGVCVDGVCDGPPEDCSRLDTMCTIGVCDAASGTCMAEPSNVGFVCDDMDPCTTSDTCSPSGRCTGVNVETQPCSEIFSCSIGTCNTITGFCVCDGPDLCLETLPGRQNLTACYDADEVIEVIVVLNASTAPVIAGELSVSFDTALLDFIEAVPGNTVDAASPFNSILSVSADESTGSVCLSVTAPIDGGGTSDRAVMALLRFSSVPSCQAGEGFCFLNDPACPTRLLGATGQLVPYLPCCTGDIRVNGEEATITCPSSIIVNADAGTVTTTANWDAPTASAGCSANQGLMCSANSSIGLNIDSLIAGGGIFPVGEAQFHCEFKDFCDVAKTCDWSVTVNNANSAEVDVQLSPRVNGGPLQRCIEFAFFANCVDTPVRESVDVLFGGPFDLPGRATSIRLKLPPDQYVCATARDPLHTLRAVADVSVVNGRFVADFAGDPFFGGNWLTGGNLNGDSVINILDFGVFVSVSLQSSEPDSTCATQGPHADLNGDGFVDILDFTFISLNFGASDADSCCPGSVATVDPPLLTEISVATLEQQGLAHLAVADLNADGLLNMDDIAAYMAGNRPRASTTSRVIGNTSGVRHPSRLLRRPSRKR